jgi:hypothetical protein
MPIAHGVIPNAVRNLFKQHNSINMKGLNNKSAAA